MKQPMNPPKELRTVEQCDAALAAGTAYVASNGEVVPTNPDYFVDRYGKVLPLASVLQPEPTRLRKARLRDRVENPE